MNGLLFFAVLCMLLIFIIGQKRKDTAEIDPPHQGTLCAQIFWPDQENTDIDLWVAGPIGKPVGFSNLGDVLWNLERDDLGTSTYHDASGKNMEIACTRGIYDGEYIINVYLFQVKGADGVWLDGAGEWHKATESRLPVTVRIVVTFKDGLKKKTEQLAYSDVKLETPKQELTVMRFLVRNGKPDMSTLRRLQKRLMHPHGSNPPG